MVLWQAEPCGAQDTIEGAAPSGLLRGRGLPSLRIKRHPPGRRRGHVILADRIRAGQFGGAMTGDQVIRGPFDRLWRLNPAAVDHVRAPRVKPASQGRVHRVWHIQADGIAISAGAVAMRIRPWNGGK